MDVSVGYLIVGIMLHVVGIILPIILIGFAGSYALKCFRELRMALNSRRWIKTDGAISNPDKAGSLNLQRGLTYSYKVSGVTYFSSQMSCDDNIFSTSRLEKIKTALKSYARERRVLVHYDPNCPQRATLKIGVDSVAVLANLMVISLVLMVSVLILVQTCLFM